MGYDYIPFSEKTVGIIIANAQDNPGYIHDPTCPYPKSFKELFSKPSSAEDLTTAIEEGPLDDAAILGRINKLATQLENYGNVALNGGSSSDANTFFRLSATLTERIITMREKLTNVVQVGEFMATVLDLLDDVCTPDQRNQVMERLKKFKGE